MTTTDNARWTSPLGLALEALADAHAQVTGNPPNTTDTYDLVDAVTAVLDLWHATDDKPAQDDATDPTHTGHYVVWPQVAVYLDGPPTTDDNLDGPLVDDHTDFQLRERVLEALTEVGRGGSLPRGMTLEVLDTDEGDIGTVDDDGTVNL